MNYMGQMCIRNAKLSPETYVTKKNAVIFMESNGADKKLLKLCARLLGDYYLREPIQSCRVR